jgi:ABC-type multidrug transport system ATPase subunit
VGGDEPSHALVAVRSRVTLVSHQSYLYDGLTAAETVLLWLRLVASSTGSPSSDTSNRGQAEKLLGSVQLLAAADQPVRGFSQGMRKRLTLLRAAIEPSQIVLLDEPFAALDPAGQALITNWIGEFQRAGRTVVFASHALGLARGLASRAMLLKAGQVAWTGPAESLPDLVPSKPISAEARL